MKYLLPLTLAIAAALGATRESPGGGATFALAAKPPPATDADPPWLSQDWPASPDEIAEESDPHAGLYAVDDPHAGLHAPADPHAGIEATMPGASGQCPVAGEMALEPTHPAPAARNDDPHATAVGHAALLAAGLEARVVARSSARNGHTIAEIHAQRSTLAKHPVRVRGTVIKRTDGILGRSYLHLWDGSAPPESHADDLTVTTTQDFEIGETVEVEGRLLVDQDLGLGYRYTALLDGATRIAN